MIFLLTVGILIAVFACLAGTFTLAWYIEEKFDIDHELTTIIFLIITAGILTQTVYWLTT